MLNVTTSAINATIISQLEASFNQEIPLFPKSFNRVLAKVLAGVIVLLYKYAGWMSLQMFVRYASFASTTINGKSVRPLVEWGRLIGVGEPIEAVHAELTIDIVVLAQGGSLPAGSQLLQATTGVMYITKTAVNLDDTEVFVDITAVDDQGGGGGGGEIGNVDNGTEISFVNPPIAIDPIAVVTDTVVSGTDGETEQAYRQRVEDRFRKRPQGGAYIDYVNWGLEAAGITAIYPYTSPTPGAVDVYAEAAGEDDGYPTANQLVAVEHAITYDSEGIPSRRPANAVVNVFSIYRTPYEVVVHGLTDAAAQADITAAIEEHIRSREPYIEGISMLPRMDVISEAAIAGVAQSIAALSSAYITGVSLSSYAVPVSADTLGHGEKAICEEVTFD